MTITEFLEARIAEDEGEAMIAKSEFANGGYGCYGPDRVLAECAAKRAVVTSYGSCQSAEASYDLRTETGVKLVASGMVKGMELAVKHLAAVYASHEDYREEWAL